MTPKTLNSPELVFERLVRSEVDDPIIKTVKDFIRLRMDQIKKEDSPGKMPASKEKLPIVKLPKAPRLLLDSPKLWIDVDKTSFIPRAVVEEILIRKNGNEKNQDSFTVFIAMQEKEIQRRWGIKPISVFSKQRHQYWDSEFIKALFIHISLQTSSNDPLVNKTAYTFTKVFDAEKLADVFNQSSIKAAKAYKIYVGELRQKNLGPKPSDISGESWGRGYIIARRRGRH